MLLNPAPAAAIPQHLWSRIDLVVPNETEAFELTGIPVDGPAGAAAAAARFRDWGARTVIITLGAQGVVISDSLGLRHRPARPAQVVDTTAAGDTFIGALAAGFAEGRDVDGAVDLGLRAASISVTRPGAQASMPHRREFNGRD